MKYLIILLFCFISVPSFSQTERPKNKGVAQKFETLYNAEDFEEIFNLFSNTMKSALPLGKTMQFLKGLKGRAGAIKNREFITYVNGSYASYKTTFDRALFAVNISIDENSKINGLLVKPYVDENLPELARNQTNLILPFHNEWTVFWGGGTEELNYHVNNRAQKGAFDLIITNTEGKSFKSNGQSNEDYYAFGKEIIAPCDATVVLVVDGIKDNKPGELNPIFVPGNTVILKTDNSEFLFFAHFKQASIVVEQGQNVQQGQLLGLCGNSGNSSEPHLHFHIQNVEDMNKATGASCYFDGILVNGELKSDYSPIKGDKVRNE